MKEALTSLTLAASMALSGASSALATGENNPDLGHNSFTSSAHTSFIDKNSSPVSRGDNFEVGLDGSQVLENYFFPQDISVENLEQGLRAYDGNWNPVSKEITSQEELDKIWAETSGPDKPAPEVNSGTYQYFVAATGKAMTTSEKAVTAVDATKVVVNEVEQIPACADGSSQEAVNVSFQIGRFPKQLDGNGDPKKVEFVEETEKGCFQLIIASSVYMDENGNPVYNPVTVDKIEKPIPDEDKSLLGAEDRLSYHILVASLTKSE